MVSPQQIDEMLSGSLSQEDEDAVLAELEALTQVGRISVAVNVLTLFQLSLMMMMRLCI